MNTSLAYPDNVGSLLDWNTSSDNKYEIVELTSTPEDMAEIWKLFGFHGISNAGSIAIGSVLEWHDWRNSIPSILSWKTQSARVEGRISYNRWAKKMGYQEIRAILHSAPQNIRKRVYVVNSLIKDVARFCQESLWEVRFGNLTHEQAALLSKLPSWQLLQNIMNTREEVPLQLAIDRSQIAQNGDTIDRLMGLYNLVKVISFSPINFTAEQKKLHTTRTRAIVKALSSSNYTRIARIAGAIIGEMVVLFWKLIENGLVDPSMYIFNTSQSSHKVYHLHPNIHNTAILAYTKSLLDQLELLQDG